MWRAIRTCVGAGAVVFALLSCGSPHVGRLSPEMRKVVDAPRYKRAVWGILVEDLDSGETVYERNADKLFAPGSTVKLFTVAAALDTLGPLYRFETPVRRRGKVSEAGEMNGDLILVASGDPTFGGRTTPAGTIAYTNVDHTEANVIDGAILTQPNPVAGLDALAKQVAGAGIKRVTGDVMVDDRLFDKTRLSPGAQELTPIMVNDNLIDFVIEAAEPGAPAVVKWRPRTSAYQVDACVKTAAAAETAKIEIAPISPGRLLVRGRIPAGRPPLARVYPVSDPASFARSLFIEALRRAGVRVDASPLTKNPTKRLPPRAECAKLPQVAVFRSPPFAETARMILKVSHNQGANILPLLMAVSKGKRTFEAGLEVERRFLVRAKAPMAGVSISDGEGGARGDRLSPRAAVELMRSMSKRRDWNVFSNSLPSLGVDGTLWNAVRHGSPARGMVHAKTGTTVYCDAMGRRLVLAAKGLAGYMRTARRRRLAFAFYVNNVLVDDLNGVWASGADLAKLCEMVYKAQ